MSGRVMFIGLDGATWTVLGPLVKDGVMPRLSAIMDAGSWGDLVTALPPGTSPGWPCLMTGKEPSSCGVFGFRDLVQDRYHPPVVNAASIRSGMFWEAAGQSGARVCVLNFPITYPVRPVNGVIVSGFMTPPGAKDYFHPAGIADELGEGILETGLRPDSAVTVDDALKFMVELREQMERRHRFFIRMAGRERWDLFMACYAEPDRVHHFLWKYIVSDRPEDARVRDAIVDFYACLDVYIGEIHDTVGDDVSCMFASDHGFTATSSYSVNVNRELASAGVLKSNIYSVRRMLHKNRLVKVQDVGDELESDDVSPVKWSRTRAWAITHRSNMASVFVNLRERYSFGIVERADYASVLGEVRAVLEGLTHNGVKVVQKVYTRDELYSGKFREHSADLLVRFAKDYDMPVGLTEDLKAGSLITENTDRIIRSGTHDENGVYLVSGVNAAPNGRSVSIPIYDIAPMTLHLCGLPVPSDMDGTVHPVFVNPDFGRDNPVRYENPAVMAAGISGVAPDGDEELVEAQLKNLGYM